MRTFAADFETTTYEGQEDTAVWSAAITELWDESDNVNVFGSIESFFKWVRRAHCRMIIYFHNLKFDGEFILSYFMTKLAKDFQYVHLKRGEKLQNKQYTYLIASRGQFYSFTFMVGHKTIEIRDSLKLLPFSLYRIGKSFKTKHQKLDMEYKGVRWPNCPISDKELAYIKNDVLVLKEALEYTLGNGHKSLTIGSCCLKEFKRTSTYDDSLYPNVYEYELPSTCKYPNVGEFVKKSYYGGWCYLVPEKSKRILTNGCTVDANSLYPSQMHSNSGNYYPVGEPTYGLGSPTHLKYPHFYYFTHFTCRFKLKDGYLPFIQIKNSPHYKRNQSLSTSDVYDSKTGLYYESYLDTNGEEHKFTVELVLTCTDFERFREHYDLIDYEPIDYIYFSTATGMFDEYIDHYAEIKQTSTGCAREEAKLFLNNLYGKMASSKDSSYKQAYLDEEDIVKYDVIQEQEKKPGYIPIGSAITSFCRDTTIRLAQKNYHPGQPGFCYADTDSLHCDCPIDQLKDIPLHNSKFLYWKHENDWKTAWFTRQKTYIEFSKSLDNYTLDDLKSISTYETTDSIGITIRCAGMPEKSKRYFLSALLGDTSNVVSPTKPRLEIQDFDVGLKLNGKLIPKRFPGGIVLTDTIYTMRDIQ